MKRRLEALSKMSQKLIEAQEEERSWIARELHDDINQRVALLAVDLERLKQNPPGPAELRQQLEERIKQLNDLAGDIQALSHRLHTSKLEYLGLASAAASLCTELSDRQKVKIDFCSENIPRGLPEDISICLFRVLQEALQNAIKHSGSQHIQVSLSVESNEIRLTVRDSGAGFDPKRAMEAQGIGLSSMKERLKLVGGTLSIDSQLNSGTTVQARVPLGSRMKVRGSRRLARRGVIRDAATGNLWGTASRCGSFGFGTVFRLEEERFVPFLLVLLRMSEIWMALIIDANIKTHAPLLVNCMPDDTACRLSPRACGLPGWLQKTGWRASVLRSWSHRNLGSGCGRERMDFDL